ncbi:hypothetical protein A9F13_05g00154 [Clavispora lusitaniae]|uniref:VPS9 domain-containing protein n=1 Tax=Clavispora lusitaniae TaxID=36911 RepID=A0AA91Q0P9_CLALS|nr:hypothetical protein A9F13_05g00154 [Clavispora lusitaniae]
MSTLHQVTQEVTDNIAKEIHPTVSALVESFTIYLKEPRYQNPLTLKELAILFQAFYADLNSLCIQIYTQSNTNKRSLLRKSAFFNDRPDVYDYLIAIANYSASSIKLVRRSDAKALFQLRVFAYYKFLTIINTIEKATYDLFTSRNPGDKFTLYDKIFRFDRNDILTQKLLSEKIHVFRQLKMPLSYFFEHPSSEKSLKLDAFFADLDKNDNIMLRKIQHSFKSLDEVRTPSAKLKHIVKVQKFLIVLLSSFYDDDSSKVNNDILLPALIYIIIYYLPESNHGCGLDLFLNFTFVKNFVNLLSPYEVDSTLLTLGSSLYAYDPTNKNRTFTKSSKKPSSNLYELLNLTDAGPQEEDSDPDFHIDEKLFESDIQVTNYIQTKFLNNGELQYYLTNFEAILYFLMNTTIKEIVPEDFDLPDSYVNYEPIMKPLHKIVEETNKRRNSHLDATQHEQEHSQAQESEALNAELRSNRSRSSSLLNTITSAVSQSVSRSRSNSTALKSPSRDSYPYGTDFEASLNGSLGNDGYGLGRMRNILGRIGSVSSMQLKPHSPDDEAEGHASGDGNAGDYFRFKGSSSFLERMSPSPTRTRSASLGSQLGTPNSSRRATLTTKFSSGVTDFMNKLGAVASAATTQNSSETVVESPLLANQATAPAQQCNGVTN